jgi:hypothetical protein
MKTARILILATLALAALLPAARAQTRDPIAGEALFREGRRLLKVGDISAACAKLEESQRLDPAPGTLANLAECEEQLGRTASAWEHWRRVGELLPASDSRRATAWARSVELEKKLSRLTIDLGADLAGALAQKSISSLVLKRDGVLLGLASCGLPLPIDPGPHTIVVTAPGRAPQTYDLVVTPGEQRRLAVSLGTRALPAAAPAAASSAAGGGLDLHATLPGREAKPGHAMLGATLLASGALVLGGGVVFGLQAKKARSDAKQGCADPGADGRPPVCWSSARKALDRDATYSHLADLAFAGGAVLTAVGGYLLFTSHLWGRPRPAAGLALSAGPLLDDAAGMSGGEVRLAARF